MPICIAGMHRSGTSLVTKMLQTSGLYLGSESDLMPHRANGREPHWENKRFVDVNVGLLAQFYGAWDCPPALPVDWNAEGLAAHRREAEVILADFDGREPWGWKDPRNCLTLPFWQSLLGSVPAVIVVRNPLEVARSLRVRNGFSYALGLNLWLTYNQRLCESVAPGNRIVTHYDRYFQDPEAELRRLVGFVGLPVDEQVIAEVCAVHDADLRHHEITTRDLSFAGVSPQTLDLYHRLSAEAQWVDFRFGAADAGATIALREALVQSGEDPDAPESARRAQRKSRGRNHARRRGGPLGTASRLDDPGWQRNPSG
jgi:hypothetical protein